MSQRKRLPTTRKSIVHKFRVGDAEGYIIAGLYNDDHKPGELFVIIAKEGSTLRGIVDGFAIMTSMALQHGVEVSVIANKLIGTSFEPAGMTDDPDIPRATSILDYIGRWLWRTFVDEQPTEPKGQDS